MEFGETIDHWKRLFRTKREEAGQFYFISMFEEVINRFLAHGEDLQKYRFLISLLGFSPQSVILFIRAIKPKKVLFIHSRNGV